MLNRHNLNIAKLAAKDDSRFTIHAIFVTPTETVETDGHQMVIVSRPAKEGEEPTPHAPFMMPTADADRISKGLPKEGAAQVGQELTDGQMRVVPVHFDGQTHAVKALSGSFPDYQRVVPQASGNKFKITLNPTLMKNLMAQFEAFSKGCLNPAVEFYFTDDAHCVRMDADGGDGQHMTAVLMPMRGDYPQAAREQEAEQEAKPAPISKKVRAIA